MKKILAIVAFLSLVISSHVLSNTCPHGQFWCSYLSTCVKTQAECNPD
jgi:hypothetical protein